MTVGTLVRKTSNGAMGIVVKSRPDGAKTEWNLITRKDIKAGEELTIHYSFYKI